MRLTAIECPKWSSAAASFAMSLWDCFSRGNAGEHEPRLLVTGLPARLRRCRQYRTRMCRQESFRDEKSHGYHWHHSRVNHPEHPDRLPLAMRSAMWMTMILGEKVERLGNRAEVKATRRSTRSVFSPGYRAWRKPHVLTAIRSPITLRFDPYNPRWKVLDIQLAESAVSPPAAIPAVLRRGGQSV